MTSSTLMGVLCQTRRLLFERVTVKDILWYPEEMVPVLVVAEDSKSLDKNYVIFKPFYFPFFHLFCKIKIWLHCYSSELWCSLSKHGWSMEYLSTRLRSSLKIKLKTQCMWWQGMIIHRASSMKPETCVWLLRVARNVKAGQ